MATYVGDFKKNATVYYMWTTTTASGSAVSPSDYGTMVAYKDDGTSESTTGITVAGAFDGIAGIHNVKVDTSQAFYTVGADYAIVASGMTVDSTNVNAVIMQFSLENRFDTDALQTISGDITTLQNTVNSNQTEIVRISGVVDTITNNLATVSGNVASMQTDITTIAGDVVNIDGAAMRGTDNAALQTTLVTVSGDIADGVLANDISAGALSKIVASGDAATAGTGWGATSASAAVTVSGHTPGALTQIVNSGNAAGWNSASTQVTVSGHTPGALTQIVNSGNAAGWNGGVTQVTCSGLTAPALSQIVASGNAENWNSSTALALSDVRWIASGVWQQNVDNGDFITSGWAGQKFSKLFSTFMYASQIVASGDERFMCIYDNNTPAGTPVDTFKLYNFVGGNPTISPQTITGRNRIST